jgi:hypothetical protein
VNVFVQIGYLSDIVLRVKSLMPVMEATKGGISFKQIAGRCSTQVDEAAACCFQPTRVVYESEMQAVGSESCERDCGSNYRGFQV